ITTELDRLSAGVPAPDATLVRDLRARGLVVTPLTRNGALLDVDCSHAQPPVGGTDLANLAPIAANICWLDLGGSAIADGDLTALAAMPHLNRLHLERTAVSDAAGPRLAACARLEYLNLVGTRIGDAGIAALAGLPAIDAIYLWQSQASEAGIAALRTALPEAVIDSGPMLEPSTAPPPKRKRRKQQ
nr:hypothetical protein [Planctomycetota bacterium]